MEFENCTYAKLSLDKHKVFLEQLEFKEFVDKGIRIREEVLANDMVCGFCK